MYPEKNKMPCRVVLWQGKAEKTGSPAAPPFTWLFSTLFRSKLRPHTHTHPARQEAWLGVHLLHACKYLVPPFRAMNLSPSGLLTAACHLMPGKGLGTYVVAYRI